MKNWQSNSNGNNYGVIIRATNENTPGRDTRFYSSAHSEAEKHPYVLVLCRDSTNTGVTTAAPAPNLDPTTQGSAGTHCEFYFILFYFILSYIVLFSFVLSYF